MLYIHSICVKGWLFESSKDQSKRFVLVCSQHVFLFNTSSAFKVKAYLRTLYPTTAIGVQTRQLTFPFKDYSIFLSDHPPNFMDHVLCMCCKHVQPIIHGDFNQKTEATYSGANRQQPLAPLAAAKALWPTTSASAIPVTCRILPHLDGENNGKPYEQMDDLVVPM